MRTDSASRLRLRSTVALVLALLTILADPSTLFGVAEGLSEHEKYVENFINTPPYGNWTFVEKPMFPVHFNQSQIPVGTNWTVICPLTANRSYHIYCYGEWIDKTANPKTDYDIYVYDPSGELEGYHTESAGLPEHLGTDVENPFFIPENSGNYSFVLRNDPRESNASRSATLMIIENVDCNSWQEAFIEGKEDRTPGFYTSWAFEFATESQHIEVLVKVPETLDMYEARLYLMGNPKAGMGEMLTNVPLAWEQGLYGKINQIYGGYNLESKEYRGLAYASCEFFGQDMLLNFTSPVKGKSLYHLVFIGEKGTGTINFLVKTEFGKAHLTQVDPPLKVKPYNDTAITFASNCTDLVNATLSYSVDDWKTTTVLSMNLADKRTCSAVIPGQPAGNTVEYEAKAMDILENILTYDGSYTVKQDTQLNLTLQREAISIGENMTLTGQLIPPSENSTIALTYTHTNETARQIVFTSVDGTFTASFKPSKEGNWNVQAVFKGSNTSYGSSSHQLKFEVTPPPFVSQYSTFIYAGAGVGAAMVIAAVVFIKRRRE